EDLPRHKEHVSRRTGLLVALGLALAVFILDQGLKALVEGAMSPGESISVIPGFLSITHIRNDGGAFGILGGSQTVLLIGSVVAVGVVFWMLLTGRPSRLTTLACGLILGGAAGNLLDRLSTGEVTDYVHFSFWYVFNAADAAITVGVAALLLTALRPEKAGQPSALSNQQKTKTDR
ncbi:MAG: signal peptidase II, partial [Actinobacteria bacterium]|nr:signal peptidase II [Actinomycetota bacterium]